MGRAGQVHRLKIADAGCRCGRLQRCEWDPGPGTPAVTGATTRTVPDTAPGVTSIGMVASICRL